MNAPSRTVPEDAWHFRGTAILALGLGILVLGLTLFRVHLGSQLAASRPATAEWVVRDAIHWVVVGILCLVAGGALFRRRTWGFHVCLAALAVATVGGWIVGPMPRV